MVKRENENCVKNVIKENEMDIIDEERFTDKEILNAFILLSVKWEVGV
jgi:hypothetical protein